MIELKFQTNRSLYDQYFDIFVLWSVGVNYKVAGHSAL